MSVSRIAAGMTAMAVVLLPTELRAGGEWPDSPNKAWFEKRNAPTTIRTLIVIPNRAFAAGKLTP
jgi:hypothetical protein